MYADDIMCISYYSNVHCNISLMYVTIMVLNILFYLILLNKSALYLNLILTSSIFQKCEAKKQELSI